MSTFSWTQDTPNGPYKNHALSAKLRVAAIPKCVGMQFVSTEEGYGRKMGESITITRLSNMVEPLNGRIPELESIPEDTITLSTVTITVSEWGRAVPYTELSQDLAAFDPHNLIQRKLMDLMKLTLDTGVFSAFKSASAKIKAEPTGISSINFDTGGAPTQQATVNLNVFHLEQIRDYMYYTLNVPPYEGDDYIMLASTKAKRGLMSDPAFETWHKYTDPAAKYNSEFGRMEQTRIVEINHQRALSGSLGAGGVLGEALVFGEDAVTMAVALEPELRLGLPQDFGRKQAVAWYGILEFGVVWDTANAGEARIVHVTST